jgi:hypothetical protein
VKADVFYAVRENKQPAGDGMRFYWELVRNTRNADGREYPAICIATFSSSAEAVIFGEWLEKVAAE